MDKKKGIVLLIVVLFTFLWLGYFYIFPIVNKISIDLNAYNTRIAYRDNYRLHTTPMPQNLVLDICKKLEIENSSEHCINNSKIYTPDFFDELKAYFNNVPKENQTYALVDEKFGIYLQHCGEVSPEGDYRCRYDFIGDGKYPFFFYFDKNNYYYRIIANIGGS